nr:uncharacterized protein LOC129267163 [Lytechinus pictus]
MKSEFAKAKVTYLGHVVGQWQVLPREAKIQAILDFPIPTTKKELLRFLGMSGFYRKFVPNYSTVVSPLTNLLKAKVKYVWSDECQRSFENLKAILVNEPVLAAPNFTKPFKVAIDACDVGVGAVLLQEDEEGIEKPVCYFSKKLNRFQKKYSTIEKEALSLVLALQQFESPNVTMPVSLSVWRVRIGAYLRRYRHDPKKEAEQSKESDNANSENSSSNGCSLVENDKAVNTSCQQPPSSDDVDKKTAHTESPTNTSGSKVDVHYHTLSTSVISGCDTTNGSSCDFRSSGNITQHGFLCADDRTLSTRSTEKQSIPAQDPSNTKVPKHCDVDELDMRYITIHRVSPTNFCTSTQISKKDQPDGTSDSYSQEARAITGAQDDGKHDKKETSNTIPHCIDGQSSPSSELDTCTSSNGEHTSSCTREKSEYRGKPSSSGNRSRSTSGEVGEMQNNLSCSGMANVLLLRSGDVEENPGPNTDPGNLTEFELHLLADRMDPSDFRKVGLALGFTEPQLSRVERENIGNIKHATYTILCEWLKTVRYNEARDILSTKLKDINLVMLADALQKGVVGDHIPSLTEDEFQRVIKEVKKYFAIHYCQIQADPLNSYLILELKQIWTNLTLMEEDKGTKRMTLLLYEDLLKTKVNGVFPQRLLVEGEGGVGKTTLCAKIVWDWIYGTGYQDFKLVLLVQLREVRDKTIGEIIKAYLPDDIVVTAMQLNKYVFSHQRDVLLVLDGLDELAGGLNGSYQIALIILNRLFKSGKVLITSRRWRSDEIRKITELRKLYAFIAVEGFSDENLCSYVTKFFHPDTSSAEDLNRFISNNEVIRENMAPYPIYTAMLCIMWKEFDGARRLAMSKLQTFSLLIGNMVQFLVDHHLSKLGLTSRDEEWHVQRAEILIHLSKIGCLAFQGLMERRLVFTEQEFNSWPRCVNTGCQVGVLTKQQQILRGGHRRHHSTPADSFVQFPHKLFQEYLSGMYLASLYNSNKSEYDRLMKYIIGETRESTNLLYFTSAQLKEVGLDIVSHLIASKDISTPTFQMEYRRIDDDFIVDVAYESQDQTVAKAVAVHLLTTSSKTMEISRGMQEHTVSGHIFIMNHRKVEKLFIKQPCGRTASEHLAEFICSSHSLRTVEIIMPERQAGANMHDVFYKLLAFNATSSKIETLHVDVDLSESPLASRHLAQFICKMNHLESLLLSGQYHGDFYSTSLSMAKDSFPQISNGCFSFNEEQQLNLESFIQSLTAFARKFEPGATSSTQDDGDSDMPSSSGNSPGQKGADVVETYTAHWSLYPITIFLKKNPSDSKTTSINFQHELLAEVAFRRSKAIWHDGVQVYGTSFFSRFVRGAETEAKFMQNFR